MDLGSAIKTLRKDLNISRNKLAERSDISVTALYNIENGLSFPSKETIDRLCTALGVPVSYLLFYSITESDLPPHKRDFFRVAVGPVREFLIDK